MWLALLALASLPPGDRASARPVMPDGETFGARRLLTCTWFSNFENSRFEQCRGATGAPLLPNDGASVRCVGGGCGQLDAAARRATHARGGGAPEGRFVVTLLGRLSLYAHASRYLGDASRIVLVERVRSVRRAR